MNPGVELDKRVCEIVGIKPRRDGSVAYIGYKECLRWPTVSTSLGECEPVLEWLKAQPEFECLMLSQKGWICNVLCKMIPGWRSHAIRSQALQHVACLAVMAIHETRKK